MTILAVRSVTGSTFEVFDGTALVFLWIALSLEDPENRRAADPARAG
jgi:hypothetical protein